MKRICMVAVSLALLVYMLPLSVFAQAIPDVIGEKFEINLYEDNILFPSPINPVVSPDGNWYAYVSSHNPRGFAVYYAPMDCGEPMVLFYEVILDGYHVMPQYGYGIDFSPDGSKMAVGVDIYDTTKGSTWEYLEGGGTKTSNGIPSIITIDILSGEIVYITDGVHPKWSPDGRYILYKNYDYRARTDPLLAEHQWGTTVYDLLTGDREFLEIPYENYAPWVFGPQGEYYYIPVYADGQYTIARMPVGGGDIEMLTDQYFIGCGNLQISSDGKLAFFENGSDILVLDIASGLVYNAITCELYDGKRIESLDLPVDVRLFCNVFLFHNGTKFGYSTFLKHIYEDGSGSTGTVKVSAEEKARNGMYVTDLDPANYMDAGDDIISAVEEQPEAFMTLGAFPNPFNPNTTLQFTLPEAGYAELTVFNLAGQQVRSLVSGSFSAGTHAVHWDGCDSHGMPVSSGIYLSRLTCRDNVVTSMMTLVK